jgi:hypothetical protein
MGVEWGVAPWGSRGKAPFVYQNSLTDFFDNFQIAFFN